MTVLPTAETLNADVSPWYQRLRILAGWMVRERLQLALELTVAVYVLLAVTTSTGGFWMPDFAARYLTMENLQWGSEGLSGPIPYPGREVDPEGRLLPLPNQLFFIPRPDGRFVVPVGIWFPIVSWLPFQLFGVGGLVLIPLLGGLASCFLAGSIAEEWRPGRGWLAVLLTAFTTPVLFYSQLFWEHAPAVACALAGCYLLVRVTRMDYAAVGRSVGWHALGLGLITVAALLRREMLVAQVVGTVWATLHPIVRKRALWQLPAANAALGLALIGIAQTAWIAQARPLAAVVTAAPRVAGASGFVSGTSAPDIGAGQADRAIDFAWRLLTRVLGALYNIDASGALTVPALGWLTGLSALLALVGLVLPGHWKWLALLGATAAITAPAAVNAWSSAYIEAVHGLILAAPIVLGAVALAGFRGTAWPLLYGLALAFAAAQTVILGSGPSLAVEWGPRVALLAYPIAAIILATANFPRHRSTGVLGLAATCLLVVLSLATQARGIGKLRSDMAYLSAWTSALERLPSSAVIVDQWWLTMAVTPAYDYQQFVSVTTPEQAKYLYEHIGQHRLAYAGVGGKYIPTYLARYFEPISLLGAGGSGAPQLWIVGLSPRPQPEDV